MKSISITEASKNFDEIVTGVNHNKNIVTLTKKGKLYALIVPVEFYKLAEKYIERLEDEEDIRDAKAALAEEGEDITLEELKKELGFD